MFGFAIGLDLLASFVVYILDVGYSFTGASCGFFARLGLVVCFLLTAVTWMCILSGWLLGIVAAVIFDCFNLIGWFYCLILLLDLIATFVGFTCVILLLALVLVFVWCCLRFDLVVFTVKLVAGCLWVCDFVNCFGLPVLLGV